MSDLSAHSCAIGPKGAKTPVEKVETMKNQSLKLSRSFGWLNATQFLGALNDNIFKLLIIFFLIADRIAKTADTTSAAPDVTSIATNVTSLATIVFVSHFFSLRRLPVSLRTVSASEILW